LEAVPKKSWQNNLITEEKAIAGILYENILNLKNVGGRTMCGTEVVALFLNCRIQPVMSRRHQMWLYISPEDLTQINATNFMEKELLNELRRLTHFSQEDSISLVATQAPYDFLHHLRRGT
jgi:hypothetical protein